MDNPTVKNLIRSITKKQLRYVFSTTKKPISNGKMRRKFITDDFIKNKLIIDIKTYRKIKEFDFNQTQVIVNHFKIDSDDI